MGRSSSNSGEDRIGFRLSKDQVECLDALAKAAGVSRHQAAKELVVLSLSGAGRHELLVGISNLSDNLNEVHGRLDELTMQQVRLSQHLAAAVEWLSLTISDPDLKALDAERLHEVITALFFEEGGELSPLLLEFKEVG